MIICHRKYDRIKISNQRNLNWTWWRVRFTRVRLSCYGRWYLSLVRFWVCKDFAFLLFLYLRVRIKGFYHGIITRGWARPKIFLVVFMLKRNFHVPPPNKRIFYMSKETFSIFEISFIGKKSRGKGCKGKKMTWNLDNVV